MTTRDEVARAVSKLERKAAMKRSARRAVIFLIFFVAISFAYSGYKTFGRAIDDSQTKWPVIGRALPRTDDLTMPPMSDIIAEFGKPPQRNSDKPLVAFIVQAASFTFREAGFGFLLGVILGMGIAIVMLRSPWIERGVSPYLVVSQTVPLVAIAPIVVIWGSNSMGWLPFEWTRWMSVSIIATFLTFFPVAMNGIRGLLSADPAAMELMRSYASTRRQTLIRLQLPASVPYVFAAFKIAATGAIVGAVVGEISGGVPGGCLLYTSPSPRDRTRSRMPS